MKKILAAILSGMLVVSMAACGNSTSSSSATAASGASAGSTPAASEAKPGQVYEINISHIVNEDNSWHKASVHFKEYLEEKSNGAIKVNIYPNSQLGNEIDAINSIMTNGGVDITFTGESLQSVVPEMGILGVPYLMRTSEQLKAVADGPVGDKLEALMAEKANMVVLGYFERGPRNITANKEIRTPDDMKGLIIRTPSSPITVAAMEALGAKPTPMALAEVFTSLQQGTIDAQENPLAMISTSNFYEVQKYLCRTEHLLSYVYIAMGKEKFDSMPADLQKLVLEAGQEMQKFENQLFLEDEKTLEGFLKEKGMTFIEDVDKEAFAAAATAGVEKVLPDALKPLYDEIKAMK